MKHFYISVFIFCFIIISSLYSNFYTNNILNSLYINLNNLTDIQELSAENINQVEKTKEIFFDKKNMLHLFVNKEHIEKLELDLLQLNSNVRNSEIESIRENTIDIITSIKYIKENLVAFD